MEASPVVTCSACGCTSRDFACCEYCNANLTPVSPPVAPTTCPITPEGPFYLSAKQAGLLTRPEASVTVFTPDKSWRLHWISSELWPEWKPRVEKRIAAANGKRGLRIEDGGSKIGDREAKIEDGGTKIEDRGPSSEDSQSPPIDPQSSILDPPSSLPVLPPCRIVEDLTGVWIVVEATGRRPEPWRGPVSEDPLDRLRHLAGVAGRGPGFWDENPVEKLGQMVAFLERLAEAMESLHAAALVWLPFHPNWIEECGSASGGSNAPGSDSSVLRATNLDLAVYPFDSAVFTTPSPPSPLPRSGGEGSVGQPSPQSPVPRSVGEGSIGPRSPRKTLNMSRSGTAGEGSVGPASPATLDEGSTGPASPSALPGTGSEASVGPPISGPAAEGQGAGSSWPGEDGHGARESRLRLVPAWTPPEVFHDQVSEIGPRTDVYHLALFTYYWLSGLLPKGFPGKGLASFEFAMPPLRILAPTLPVGIAGVVMSGLAVEPGNRPESPRAFCDELRAAVDAGGRREKAKASDGLKVMSDQSSVTSNQGRVTRPERREGRDDAPVFTPFEDSGRATQPPLITHHSSLITDTPTTHDSPLTRWDIGSHARTGRAKEAKGGVNQDSVLIRRFANPNRALLVVADGLSCCDVGSGDVASRLVCEAIDASFSPGSYASDFSTQIPCACRRGAEAMLAWALDLGERLRLKAGQDLMATTVLAAWLEGDTMILANAGDSRAYLIHERGIEQLTVDADLGCTLLAAGSPPENVIELGPVTRALRSCVGGVLYKSATDELVVDDARFRLVVNRWKLLPGETVILCSDGLVEEGAFLEPAELLELVRQNADLSAEALAFALSEAADARQTLPSQEEPEGCGDNISCCVIKISQ